jgi:hypothetical protein
MPYKVGPVDGAAREGGELVTFVLWCSLIRDGGLEAAVKDGGGKNTARSIMLTVSAASMSELSSPYLDKHLLTNGIVANVFNATATIESLSPA